MLGKMRRQQGSRVLFATGMTNEHQLFVSQRGIRLFFHLTFRRKRLHGRLASARRVVIDEGAVASVCATSLRENGLLSPWLSHPVAPGIEFVEDAFLSLPRPHTHTCPMRGGKKTLPCFAPWAPMANAVALGKTI
jgi:hypothetical protein